MHFSGLVRCVLSRLGSSLHHRNRNRLCVALSAVFVAVLAACGSSSDQSTTENGTITSQGTTTSRSLESGLRTTPSAEGTPQKIVLQHSWKDEDGYSYQVEVTEPTITVTNDTANSKPGRTDLTWEFVVTARLTNTTPARNAPFPDKLSFRPAWTRSTSLCGSRDARTDFGFSTNDDAVEAAWCTLTNMPMFLAATDISEQGGPPQLSGTLGIDQTMELTARGTNLIKWTIPEAEYDALADAIKAPTVYVLGGSYNDRPDNSQCLLVTRVPVFAETQRTGCLT